MNELRFYIIFGKKWYPSLMCYQAGIHLSSILIFLPMLIYTIYKGEYLCGFCWFLLITGLELVSFFSAFDENLARKVKKHGYGGIELFY
jgi:hypothetical protein